MRTQRQSEIRVGIGSGRRIGIAMALVAVGMAGCASIVTRKADLESAPDGVRVYPPKVCLLVDGAANSTVFASLPDLARAYDVKPLTVLAKQDWKLELEAGQLTALTANQDTSAFPRFVTDAAQLAAGAAGAGVSASGAFKGTFGFSDGVHCMRDDGSFAP
jgi:hypothetical protein